MSNRVAPMSKRCPSRTSWLHRPPGASFFSNTLTWKPALARRAAVAMPPRPAPITRAVGCVYIYSSLSHPAQRIQPEQRLQQQLGWQGRDHQTIFPQGGCLIQKAEDPLGRIALEQCREDRLDPLPV